MVAGTPSGPTASALASSMRALYPSSADATAVSLPTALISAERLPPPNPMLQKEYAKIGGAGAVRAEPAALHFAGIEIGAGGSLVQKLRLINSSGHPIRMHVLPPSTPFFTISFEKKGRLMPGLAEEILVRFAPNEVRYYHDTIKVHLGDGDENCMLVPIHAYPAVGELAFPARVDFGIVAQGQSRERVLPLHSPDGAEFEWRIEVRQPHADFVIQPRSGIVPARGEAAIVVTFTPSRLATAHCVFELLIAQLGYAPKTISLVGTSAPLQVKDATLARLRHSEDERMATEEVEFRGRMYPYGAPRRAAGDDPNLDDPASGAAGDPALAPSVLTAPPPAGLIEKIAHEAPYGGGSAGGDYVTRARAAQLREAIGDASVEVKYREERPSYPEEMKEGLRVPPFLSNQYAVNSMLLQQPYKMRVSDLRLAIEEQQADAARQQEEMELAAMASLPVQSQLLQSLGKRVDDVIAYLFARDSNGVGTVTRKQFQGVRHLLKVPTATAADMGEFFDGMDHLNAGELDYMQLQRVAKRRAATLGGGTGRMTSTSVEPGELDIALQGPERTRQLKDMLFSKEVDAIETYEKMKEVKSFVATGPPLTQPFIIEATHRARDVFYAEKRREERAVARARQATELSDPAKVRVEISEPVAKLAADTTPMFDSYEAEEWGKREGVMFDLQLAVRMATLRARLSRRVAAVHAALAKAGIGLHDTHAVHQLVLSRSKAGGGGGKSAGLGSTSTLSDSTVGGGSLSALAKAAKAVGLSMEGLAPFIFPEAPSKGAGVPQGDPLPIKPIEPFDETKLFALRVPRRYVQMDYREALLSAPGAFPPMVDDRPLRIGAPFESGRLLPTGTAVPVPDTWGLPSLLLMPPPRPPPPPEPDDLSATKALGGEAKEAAGDEEEDAELSWDDKHRMQLAQLKPPMLVQVHPRVMCRPPRAVETDARQMFRPMPLTCNEFWKAEPIGFGSGLVLLEAASLSGVWRRTADPWADAIAELPERMEDVNPPDAAKELSEDESDTEIDPSLLFPPSLDKVGQIFDLPALPEAGTLLPTEAGGSAASAVDAKQASAAAVASESVDDGDVEISPERDLIIDAQSEHARAEADLELQTRQARRMQRLRLREQLASLNEHIEQTRHQLSLTQGA